MFDAIVIVRECRPRVVRRIDIDALDLARELLLQSFQRQHVVTKDQAIVEDIILGHALRSVMRLVRVFQQDAWFQPRALVFADPGEFKFRFGHRTVVSFQWSVFREESSLRPAACGSEAIFLLSTSRRLRHGHFACNHNTKKSRNMIGHMVDHIVGNLLGNLLGNLRGDFLGDLCGE